MLLTSPLGELVRTPLTKMETLAQVMASRPPRAMNPADEIPQDMQIELVRSTLDRHYRETLEQPAAMLGGITPRVAVNTKKGREKLVARLKFLENQTGRHRDTGDLMGSYDFTWM